MTRGRPPKPARQNPEILVTPGKTNQEYIGFTRRAIRGLGKRVGDGDIEMLPELFQLIEELRAVVVATIGSLRRDYGYSWIDIARVLDKTRQGARQLAHRWGYIDDSEH